MVDRFRGRKSYPTQNVLAVVDFDLRFTYVLAGWEGSAHDSLVLHDALSSPNGLKIPKRKFYLADAGYATRPGILPPYRGVRYHLQEFLGPQDPKCPKELFNHRHSSLRTTVERAFGTLKNRFKILSNKPFIPLKSQAKVVVACCALNNWILENGPDELVFDEATWYSHLPRSSNRVSDREPDSNIMGKQKEVVKSEDAKPTTFKWKKQHHLQCAEALNGKFGIGATRNQVDRHFRSCKEKWNWIHTTMGKSGFGFDAAAYKFNIDPSEKDPKKLGTMKYNYLTRPIKFFHLLEELFVDSAQADGSLALDQSTVNVASDNAGNRSVKELEG
uniref:PH01B035L11.2 protein n=1 Tax=Phyllostachys edulis TaxID=38705 RepID=L0P2H4_PHYED|nr:PH01B035L11.2 [Phyllostachys edulis]